METDERFTHIAKDPRFRKIPSKKRKVKIDSRFQRMFSDKNFNTKYFVDKRGRKVKESASEDFSTFYELSDKEDESAKVAKDKIMTREDSSSESNIKVMSKKRKKMKKKAKKEISTSEDKANQRQKEQENQFEEEEEIQETFDVLSASNDKDEVAIDWQNHSEAPTTEESTRRLAICNMDWDKITADDLFVLLNSFVPSGGSIESVTIYPSDYGLERMRREDEIGPTELVDVESEEEAKDNDEEYNKEKLRLYQLNRLKYYYAVVVCNSSETAEKLYEECDGMEYEASSSHLDLRFIPEDMLFDRQATSQATEMPCAKTYKPSEFITTALQQSTVRLTWDETDPRRIQTTMKNFSKDDLLDMDFKAYLASSSGSSDEDSERNFDEETGQEDEDRKIAKYKKLLEEINKKEKEVEAGNEMEITWEVGLKENAEELVKRKKDEKERKELTPWEYYLNEKKQKRKIRQQAKMSKDESQSTSQLSDDELPPDVDMNDPFFAEELTKMDDNVRGKRKDDRKRKKGKNKAETLETEEEKRQKAELQLLMMEDDDGKKHFNLKSIMKNEKSRKKGKKKQPEIERDDFEIDVNDARFSALYSSHLYAVDPSDPQFKKTKAMESIIHEKQRRLGNNTETLNNEALTDVAENTGKKKTTDPGLSALVKNVKANTGKFKDMKSKGSKRKR